MRSRLLVMHVFLMVLPFCVASSAKSNALKPFIVVDQTISLGTNGETAILQIYLKKGEKVVDKDFSPIICGTKIEGSFVAKVKMPKSTVFVETDLNRLMKTKKLSFCAGPWKVITKDYNGDGRIDFNLGQYGNSNGWLYWLFTILPSGRINMLSIQDSILDGAVYLDDHKNSSDQIEVVPEGIRYLFYANTGDEQHPWGWWRSTWVWKSKDAKFVLSKEDHYGENRPASDDAP